MLSTASAPTASTAAASTPVPKSASVRAPRSGDGGRFAAASKRSRTSRSSLSRRRPPPTARSLSPFARARSSSNRLQSSTSSSRAAGSSGVVGNSNLEGDSCGWASSFLMSLRTCPRKDLSLSFVARSWPSNSNSSCSASSSKACSLSCASCRFWFACAKARRSSAASRFTAGSGANTSDCGEDCAADEGLLTAARCCRS
mmetsp:Transcript_20586/g.57225  ORF Transcript_20586/g.57225 Transcript_20586/m.57225 type:complete len:200 (+) Transcript_20586:1070-1669(+)